MRISAYILLLIALFLVRNSSTNAQESSGVIHHIVLHNESAYQISQRYSVPIDSIRVWNYLDRNYRVVEGMELIIKHTGTKLPEVARLSRINIKKNDSIISVRSKAGFHLVKGNENLSQISLLYHLPVDSIRLWNNLGQNDTVSVGQRLIISGRNSGNTFESGDKVRGLGLATGTSGNIENKLSPDSQVVVPKGDFLPVYSELEVKKEKSSFKDKILFLYHRSNYLIGIILLMNLFFFISAILLSVIVFVRRMHDGYIGIKRKKCED
ncbi:MAG TPA: LysM peptidoglycan-binding domain-containing protein, partial [Prolixibacteraceae bacterium]